METLEDIGRIRGASSSNQHGSAISHFKDFLIFINSRYRSLNDFPENEIKDELIGLFSDYLFKHAKLAYNTHDQYVSNLHSQIAALFPLKKQMFADYYGKVRTNLKLQHQAACRSSKSAIVNHATPMTFSDLEILCKRLSVERNFELRALFALDWACVGRASEVFITHY
jgi:hypothetical protein